MSEGSQENKRSCKRCNQRKVRCDRNSPCDACVKAGDRCVFPGPKRAPRTLKRPPVGELVARLAELEAEVQELRSKHQSNRMAQVIISSDSNDRNDARSRYHSSQFGLPSGGFLGYSSLAWSQDSFRRAHLQPLQIEALWRVYCQSVAPLIAVVHLPTAAAIVQNASNGHVIDSASEALLLSICFAAVVSLTPDQLYSELGLEYHQAKSAYEFAVDQALTRADFIQNPGILTLQAAVLYLLCARVDGDTRVVWAKSALVIRLAQSQNIHRDGTNTGLSPFETEVRRRLWWHICILDMLSSEDQCMDMQIRPGTFDTQLPTNVNGDELEPHRREIPAEKTGFADITLCILVCFMIREAHLSPLLLDPTTSLEQKQEDIKSVGEILHRKYLDHFDLSVPIQWISATIARLHLSKFWISVHSHISSPHYAQTAQHKDLFFRTAVEAVEFAYFLQTNEVTAHWAWLCRSYKQKDAVACILDGLSWRTHGPETDRAWEVVIKTISLWRQGSSSRSGGLEPGLLGLIQRADLLRAKHLDGR